MLTLAGTVAGKMVPEAVMLPMKQVLQKPNKYQQCGPRFLVELWFGYLERNHKMILVITRPLQYRFCTMCRKIAPERGQELVALVRDSIVICPPKASLWRQWK